VFEVLGVSKETCFPNYIKTFVYFDSLGMLYMSIFSTNLKFYIKFLGLHKYNFRSVSFLNIYTF